MAKSLQTALASALKKKKNVYSLFGHRWKVCYIFFKIIIIFFYP